LFKGKTNRKLRIVVSVILFCQSYLALASDAPTLPDTIKSSTLEQAKIYLRNLPPLDSSLFWPNVKPAYFTENLNMFLTNPLYSFDNKNTNFCGYTAISFVALEMDPVGYLKFLVELYKSGEAKMGKDLFKPSARVREHAGKLKYKGMLDINPATQMWFLTLADHYKGYLNIFNMRFHENDENKMWAATNFAKFNRMLRKLFDWKVQAKGADLVHPPISDIYSYLDEKLKTGIVFLYLNNRLLYKKKHVIARVGIPTHYVLLKEISRQGNMINIIYMDGGRKTHQQISPGFLKKILFGITYCTYK
jgi:hypothetical protein